MFFFYFQLFILFPLPRLCDDCLKTYPMMCLTGVSLQKAKHEANILTSLSFSFLNCVSRVVNIKQLST